MRILLIENKAGLIEALSFHLKKAQYLVDIAFDGQSGLEMAESKVFDLIILDCELSGMAGVAVLRELRSHKITTPVIFLTAQESVNSRIEGLDAGADDCLGKPFANEELLARIRAILRRPKPLLGEKLMAGSLFLDPQRCEIYCEDVTIKLTFKEAQLLELLMRNRNVVLTKERIFERIWGFASEVELSIVETYICYLRRKIASLNSRVSIGTVRGIGYCLESG